MIGHTPPSFVIRKAALNDVNAIHDLIMAATQSGKILKRSPEEIRKVLRRFYVVEAEGRLIACGALEVYNKKLAEIRSLAVDSAHQKKGIASALLDACLKDAKKKGIYEVLAITDRENLFKRRGFSEQLHGQKALFLRP